MNAFLFPFLCSIFLLKPFSTAVFDGTLWCYFARYIYYWKKEKKRKEMVSKFKIKLDAIVIFGSSFRTH